MKLGFFCLLLLCSGSLRAATLPIEHMQANWQGPLPLSCVMPSLDGNSEREYYYYLCQLPRHCRAYYPEMRKCKGGRK